MENENTTIYDLRDSIWYRASEIRRKEMELARKPTKKDIRETRAFLRDFGYTGVKIPDLPTYNALVSWRKGYVVKKMDEAEAAEIARRKKSKV